MYNKTLKPPPPTHMTDKLYLSRSTSLYTADPPPSPHTHTELGERMTKSAKGRGEYKPSTRRRNHYCPPTLGPRLQQSGRFTWNWGGRGGGWGVGRGQGKVASVILWLLKLTYNSHRATLWLCKSPRVRVVSFVCALIRFDLLTLAELRVAVDETHETSRRRCWALRGGVGGGGGGGDTTWIMIVRWQHR